MTEKYKDIIIILFLFSLAFVIRLLLISKGPFELDALELAINSEKTLETLSIHYMHGPGYPLTVVIGSIFVFLMRLIGIYDSVFSVNFMSVVFGSLGIAIFYLFSRKILNMVGALFSSLIFTFLPLNVSLSTYGMTHPLSIFFNLLGFYFLFLYFEKYKLRNLILAAIFLGFTAAVRLTDGLTVIAVIFLYLILSFKNSNVIKKIIIYRLALFLVSFVIIILFFYLPMLLKIGFSQFRDTMSVYYYSHKLKYLFISLKWIIEILSLSGVVILFAGIGYFFLEKGRILFYFLLIWSFSLFFYYGSLSIAIYRYLLLALIPLLILQGYFISKVFTLRHPRIIFSFSLFILVAYLVAYNFIKFYPVVQFRHKYDLQKDFAKFVQRKTGPSSYIIALDEALFLEYYTNRKIIFRATGLNKKDFDDFFKKVDNLLCNGNAVYIISSGIYGYDPRNYFIETFLKNYNFKYIGQHINEDWHNKSLNLYLFMERLYKIEKKS